MPEIEILQVSDGNQAYKDLARDLPGYKEDSEQHLFIVEGTLETPIIGIKYPGKKVRKRTELTRISNNSCLWANLLDFEVVIFDEGRQVDGNQFTFQNMMKDFYENKIDSLEFWNHIEEIYKNNRVGSNIPELSGIDSEIYLYALKWIWIQEDFNYRFGWDSEEIQCNTRYRLENRTGTPTSKGAGRAKFYAALILLKNGFDFKQVKKIIPLF